jgi:signal transduction histidine kinase
VGFLLIRSVRDEVRRREEVQRLAAELAASNKRLRQLDELKSTMVSIASHQIRGPLGGMRGYLTMFRDGDLGPLTDKQKDIVKMNINVLTRLLNAVETFLDITRLEAGKMLLKKEVLPLDEAVKDVVDEFRVMAEKKGLRLICEIDAPSPVWVEFDPEKIKHVIFNLVDNAMKYTEKGSVTARVKVVGKEVLFEVSDTGMGVPPDDLHRLFGKFERGELVVDRGGSGLGLYVVKMLTELQGGRVWVSSPGVGKGATFSVALPLSAHFDHASAG